jgi:hypothetical protein
MAFAYADLTRLPAADFAVGGRTYGVYGHDWRVTPPVAWLTVLGERELGTPVTVQAAAPTLVVLNEPDFAEAVRAALHDLSRADRLRDNPLLWSRIVAERVAADADTAARVAALQQMLRTAIGALAAHPRDARLQRALHHTYVQPAPTQEAAAELLDLPFSTYRRHLKDGVQRVVQMLWQQETGPD